MHGHETGLFDWQGLTGSWGGLRNHGGDSSGNVIGDLQTASNIEAPDNFLVHQSCHSKEGKGSTFHLYIPLLGAQEAIAEPAQQKQTMKGQGEVLIKPVLFDDLSHCIRNVLN